MVSPNLQAELAEELNRLNEVQQQQVLAYARRISKSPQGMPLRSFLKFAGTITPEEASEMSKIIEEGCENIDHAGW